MVASVAGVMEETGDSAIAAVGVSEGLAARAVAGIDVDTGVQAVRPVRNTTIKAHRMIWLFISFLSALRGIAR
jgi:hypothetical protein